MLSCSLWFTSELNAKDHIEGIHKFQEGHDTSFYECLRQYGIEWFGSRTFFEGCRQTTQAIWMYLALAHRLDKSFGTLTSLPRARNTPLYGGSLRPLSTSCRYYLIRHFPRRNFRRDRPWKSRRGTWIPPLLYQDELHRRIDLCNTWRPAAWVPLHHNT